MISDWSIPIPRPTAAAIANDWKRATSTAASAGTMYSVYAVGSTVEIGAIRMPAAPARMVARIQLPPEVRSADRPITDAPVSFSATARVARPKRVKR